MDVIDRAVRSFLSNISALTLTSTTSNYNTAQADLTEGYGFQFYQAGKIDNNVDNTNWMVLVAKNTHNLFWVLFLVLIWGCCSNGFRSFFRRIRNRVIVDVTKKKTALFDPSFLIAEPPVIVSSEATTAAEEEESQTSSSSSSLRETSLTLLQVATERGLDMLPFNFSPLSMESNESLTIEEEEFEPDWDANVVHFCFLVHGHRGFSKDLSYLQQVMRRTAAERRNNSDTTSNSNNNTTNLLRHDMVVCSPSCNERKTDDGVVAGGDRLVEEIEAIIVKEMDRRQEYCRNSKNQTSATEIPTITLSFVGNSLGGLYSRYAIAKLAERCTRDAGDPPALLLNGKYRFHMNIFCTTATPHLGCASHTFIRIPRTAELGIAHGMGETGRDIFRVNDLLRQMATLSQYIKPLRLFRQRIAYANAYGTDFPVPAQTAAFLNEQSDYPHFFSQDDDLRKLLEEEHSDLHIATMHTKPSGSGSGNTKENEEFMFKDEDFDKIAPETVGGDQELVIMSRSLDSLGWKKVFVDPRKFQPKMSNPIRKTAASALARLNLSSTSTSTSGSDGESFYSEDEDESSEHNNNDSNNNEAMGAGAGFLDISRLKARGVAGSREVFQAVTSPPEANEQPFHWPFGHNMIVAMSRNSVYTYLNKGGRPIVHALATQLVEDIFSFTINDETQKEQQQDQNQ